MAAQEKEKEHAADKCNTWQACNKSILDEKYHSSQMQHLCPWWKIKIISHTFRNPLTWPLDQPQYHNEQNNNNLCNSDLKLSCFLLPIECWGCRWIRLIVIDKTLLCERFSPHILKASTENSQVQKTCKYRKKVSTEYRQVQKIGKYRIQASTENR